MAVAAAIVPSVAASAIGFAWGRPQIALGAFVLLLVNVARINLTAYLGFYALGYRTELLDSVRDDRSLSVRSGAYAFVTAVFVVGIVLTVFTTAQHLAFETTAKSEVETTLEQPEYEELGLVSVSTEYATRGGVYERPDGDGHGLETHR